MRHKGADLAVRFDLSPASIQRVQHRIDRSTPVAFVAFDLLSAPLYMVGQLNRLIDLYRVGQLRGEMEAG